MDCFVPDYYELEAVKTLSIFLSVVSICAAASLFVRVYESSE